MNPKVTLSTERAPQGGIVAVQLSGILDGEPSLETDLGTVWFRKTASGYMGYIPVTYNAEGGDHTLHLTCGSLEKDITLTVTRTMYDTVTVPAEEDTGGGGGVPQRYMAAVHNGQLRPSSGMAALRPPARALSPWSTVLPRWWTASAAARPPA